MESLKKAESAVEDNFRVSAQGDAEWLKRETDAKWAQQEQAKQN